MLLEFPSPPATSWWSPRQLAKAWRHAVECTVFVADEVALEVRGPWLACPRAGGHWGYRPELKRWGGPRLHHRCREHHCPDPVRGSSIGGRVSLRAALLHSYLHVVQAA